TLINLLSGDLLPSSGRIEFAGRDITQLPAHRVSRLGIGRSYQRTNIFPGFTCWQNCWLAGQSRERSSLRFVRPANAAAKVRARAEAALATAGLDAMADVPAADLSYGEQRQLEIAMLLAMEPDVLLL
ncbi:MAG: ATP-binding cassette domain-containing protein, partial [Rhodospirillaceae bacterium]